MLVDSHCHLTFPDFKEDLPDIFARAAASDIGLMLTISTKLAEAPLVQSLADAHEQIYCTVGVHPHEAETDAGITANQLVDLAQHSKTVGIGETGLDYYYTSESKDIQQESLRIHIEAARQTRLPLIIHARDADDDMARILTEGPRLRCICGGKAHRSIISGCPRTATPNTRFISLMRSNPRFGLDKTGGIFVGRC